VNCRTHEHRHFERTLRVSDSVRNPRLAEGRMTNKPCRGGARLVLADVARLVAVRLGARDRVAVRPPSPGGGRGGTGGGALSRYRSLALDRRRRGPRGYADRRPYASCGADCRLVVGVRGRTRAPGPAPADRLTAVSRACARPLARSYHHPSSVAASAPLAQARSALERCRRCPHGSASSADKTRACPHHVARPRTRRRRWRANHLRDLGSGETTRRI
jgi:hypothetical protein